MTPPPEDWAAEFKEDLLEDFILLLVAVVVVVVVVVVVHRLVAGMSENLG